MERTLVYIKIEQNNIVHNKKVFLEDVAKLYSPSPGVAKELGKLCLITVKGEEDVKFTFSIMKIVDMIGRTVKDVRVINEGESDFIISYEKPRPASELQRKLKAFLVATITFFGASFTIMTFNEDVSVGAVFENIYDLFGAGGLRDYYVIEVTYSIGLFIGIMVFFNHFSKKKSNMDPTPLQIEMKAYEKDMNSAIITSQAREGKTYDI